MGDSPNIKAGKQDPVLKQAELDYIKIIEQKNRERVEKLQRITRRNRLTGLGIGAGVFGIYMYSILAVKQETFLDDFEEPAKVQQ
ncbi:cytochrome c oxidase assembly factor 3, mitochondrial [Danaus plexippus]|uniref:cytochrome c oxidase assembly factor 3, mitochondrial n=1 Tax=Danaus plexippus TaxID=13037 RepID=UPI000239BAA5|nr:cytochrome c oxidase assembly factor 3, mitochondrial [Danaus plexippus]